MSDYKHFKASLLALKEMREAANNVQEVAWQMDKTFVTLENLFLEALGRHGYKGRDVLLEYYDGFASEKETLEAFGLLNVNGQ